MRPSRFTWRRWVMTIAAVSLGWSGLSGCTAARDTLGTNSSPCFHALAIAADAVHDRGVFAGVRLVSASSLAKIHRVEAVAKARSTTPCTTCAWWPTAGTFASPTWRARRD